MRMLTLSTLLCGALLAAPAFGQDASQEAEAPGAEPILRPVPGTEPGADGRRTADTILWHAEDLLGTSIRNLRDEKLGTVEDVVINPHQGVIHVLVDTGGILGVGEERVAIALSEMTVRDDGTLVLDSSPGELASREQYRFPESPLTGAIMPDTPTPQTAAGIGAPQQAPQYIPGVTGVSPERRQRADLEEGEVRDTPLAQVLRDDAPGPTSQDAAVTFENRDQYLQAAAQRLNEVNQRIGSGLGGNQEALRSLSEQYAQAAARLQTLQQASDEAWPTALENFRISLARLQEDVQQAEATSTGGGQRQD